MKKVCENCLKYDYVANRCGETGLIKMENDTCNKFSSEWYSASNKLENENKRLREALRVICNTSSDYTSCEVARKVLEEK